MTKRPLPRFSLGMLFVVVTVLGIWLGVQVKWISDRDRTLTWIQEQALVWEDLPVDQGAQLGDNAPTQLRLLGASGLQHACVVIAEKDRVRVKQRELEKLFPEASILVLAPGSGYKGRHADKQVP